MDLYLKDLLSYMIESQLLSRGIHSKKVIAAFYKTPRHFFVDDAYLDDAYSDYPLPISCDQTISQPYMVALMTQALDIKKTDIILEIGTGSGYQSAILSHLAHKVYTIERHKALFDQANIRFAQLKLDNIFTFLDNGFQGLIQYAPFDKIIVTAAPKKMPHLLVEQLKENGSMVIPIGNSHIQTLYLCKKEDGKLKKSFITYCRFVEMVL